ncbi:uncharacterized protein LOC117322617 [Pecten maximus]|uniref:uncharacterized protein LOC117322617 n=1 Tax=Pecten maximus TaxID=6579 RepID=UPI001458E58E|nr:uncharacterized protein LOC117322617 [Pecten maximus]
MATSVLLYWTEERSWSVQSISTITEPKKDYGEVYIAGDRVKARFQGSSYPGLIVQISSDREILKKAGMRLEVILQNEGSAMDNKTLVSKLCNRMKQINSVAETPKPAEDNMNPSSHKRAKQNAVAETLKPAEDIEANMNPSLHKRAKQNTDVGASPVGAPPVVASPVVASPILASPVGVSAMQTERGMANRLTLQGLSANESRSIPREENQNECDRCLKFQEETKKEMRQLKNRIRDLEKKMRKQTASETAGRLPDIDSTSTTPIHETPTRSFTFTATNTPPHSTTSTHSEITTPVRSSTPTTIQATPALQATPNNDTEAYNGHTLSHLQDSISHTDTLYVAVRILLLLLFPEDYIISHSVSGKAANSKTEKNPSFDSRLFGIFLRILKSKFPNNSAKDVTEKIHSVQKSIMKKQSK